MTSFGVVAILNMSSVATHMGNIIILLSFTRVYDATAHNIIIIDNKQNKPDASDHWHGNTPYTVQMLIFWEQKNGRVLRKKFAIVCFFRFISKYRALTSDICDKPYNVLHPSDTETPNLHMKIAHNTVL